MAIAEQACTWQKKILVAAISRQAAEHGLEKLAAAFLGMECARISERYRRIISDVFPAYTVARLEEIESPISSKDYKSKRQFKGLSRYILLVLSTEVDNTTE